jgi:hypothetical protein
MFMGRFYGADTMRARRLAGLPLSLPCPSDFEAVFLEIGRLACQEHYRVGRDTVNRWLEQHGKQRLIETRAAIVRKRADAKRLDRHDVAKILRHAYPTDDAPVALVEQAAQFLRLRRNGGWPVSRSADGMWMVGISRKTGAEVIEIAKRKGFTPSLSGGA